MLSIRAAAQWIVALYQWVERNKVALYTATSATFTVVHTVADGADLITIIGAVNVAVGVTTHLTVTPLSRPRANGGIALAPVTDLAPEPPKPTVAVTVVRERGGRGPLGRNIEHDERSRAYAVPLHRDAGKAVRWVRRAPILNQGEVGSCTGEAMAGWLGTDNAARRGDAAVRQPLALSLYQLATRLDSIPGHWPTDTGSSGLGVVKAAKQMGRITSYKHGFSVTQALSALAVGPVLTGTDWFEGFDEPDEDGIVALTGSVRGGHEYLVRGYDPATGLLECDNSWGRGWSKRGKFWLQLTDWTALLRADGDVTVPQS